MADNLTYVIKCVTNCYMRNILNISLPQSLADMVRDEVENGKYASVSEFIRELLREWSKQQAIKHVRQSEREYRQGKYKVLKSLRDLR